jgi:lipoprotein-anchoring transpeptidase ErfK/SrfK
VGEADDGIHRVWYELGSDGFAYSGNIQPVRTLLNQPAVAVREGGVLGEISVPYTDAHEAASETSPVAFRLYYESTHWIKASRQDTATGRQWYQAWDDKWKKHYYAAAEHVRLVPDEELTPLSPGIPETEKRILVHLGGQYVTALEAGRPVFSARVSTGSIFRAGRYATPTGSFRTYFKRPTRHMASGDVAASGYDLPGVPWVSYINEDGIGFHGTYWHNEFGRPRSHGCINLTPQAAKWLYRWTLPTVHPAQESAYLAGGTRVEILA